MKIKDNIKLLRKSMKMTQVDFADKIKISNGFLAQLETGVREVNERMIKLICNEFNVSEKWLRTGEGEMFVIEEDYITQVLLAIQNADELDRKIVTEYLRLSKAHKDVFKTYIKNIASGMKL